MEAQEVPGGVPHISDPRPWSSAKCPNTPGAPTDVMIPSIPQAPRGGYRISERGGGVRVTVKY